MNNVLPNSIDFVALYPVLVLGATGLILLALQFAVRSQDTWILQLITLIAFVVTGWFVYGNLTNPGPGKYFQGHWKISELVTWLHILYLILGFLTVAFAPPILKKHNVTFPEFFPLILFATIGMVFMTSSSDLIVIFIGLEVMSLALYVLIGMARNTISALEATMKYFLLGSFSSGFMLMGIAFLYGGSGSTDLETSLAPIASLGYFANFTIIGLGFLFIGIFFKVALVPFHAWTPDVYEGSLTAISGFMASGPKSASMALLLIIVMQIPFGDQTNFWFQGLGILSVLSMTWGNLAALRQTNLKRILAYSSVSHGGYVLAGIVAGSSLEVLFYLYIYAFTNLTGFALISYLEGKDKIIDLNSLAGLSARSPWTSVGLAICFLSLAGFPPLAGFWSKLFLLQKLAESSETWVLGILVIAVINSAIAFFYYSKVLIYTFMAAGRSDSEKEKGSSDKSSADSGQGSFLDTDSEPQSELGLALVSVLGVVFLSVSWLIFQPRSFL